MYKKKYVINDYEVKSYLEYYFALWLNELVNAGYVDNWEYETETYDLYDGLRLPYTVQMKTKVKDADEHIFHKASYTEDFVIFWNKKAANVFYLDPKLPLLKKPGDIQFRLAEYTRQDRLVSLVDVKSTNASTTSSSVSQPYKAKWVYDKYGVLIHKIYPFSSNPRDFKKTLFYRTFTPELVLNQERYVRDCKYGKKGASKIKFETRSLDEFLKI